jgi:hypothetical protein
MLFNQAWNAVRTRAAKRRTQTQKRALKALDRAIRHFQVPGNWLQLGFGGINSAINTPAGCTAPDAKCVVIALKPLNDRHTDAVTSGYVLKKVREELGLVFDDEIYEWNDARGRTVEDVIALLERVKQRILAE